MTWIDVLRHGSNQTLHVGAWGIQIGSDGLIQLHDGIARRQGNLAFQS